jgi:hypothetical protein
LQEKEINEFVKSVLIVLIINNQRNKELTKRQPVHENQIELARLNNSLIIET